MFMSVLALVVLTSLHPVRGQDVSPDKQITVYYPVGRPLINSIDTIVVSWASSWNYVNNTLYCEVDNATQFWRYYRFPIGDSSGQYILPNINSVMRAYQFPSVCHIDFANLDNQTERFGAVNFIMTATGGPPITRSAGASTASSASTAVLTENSFATTSTATVSQTLSSTSAADSTSTTIDSNNKTSEHGSLSPGVKIAIGVAVPIVMILASLLAFFLWRRSASRKRHSPVAKIGSVNNTTLSNTDQNELETRLVSELGCVQSTELEATHSRTELDAGKKGRGDRNDAQEMP